MVTQRHFPSMVKFVQTLTASMFAVTTSSTRSWRIFAELPCWPSQQQELQGKRQPFSKFWDRSSTLSSISSFPLKGLHSFFWCSMTALTVLPPLENSVTSWGKLLAYGVGATEQGPPWHICRILECKWLLFQLFQGACGWSPGFAHLGRVWYLCCPYPAVERDLGHSEGLKGPPSKSSPPSEGNICAFPSAIWLVCLNDQPSSTFRVSLSLVLTGRKRYHRALKDHPSMQTKPSSPQTYSSSPSRLAPCLKWLKRIGKWDWKSESLITFKRWLQGNKISSQLFINEFQYFLFSCF